MSFDPYFKWLGISAEDQQADHYRLLGIPTFVSDPDVIEHAADQRMAHIRTLGAGQHTNHAQRILNELAAAKVTLLHPDKKRAYDARLRESRSEPKPELQTGRLARPEPLPGAKPARQAKPSVQPANPQKTPAAIITSSPSSTRRMQHKKASGLWMYAAALGVVVFLAATVAIVLTRDTEEPVAPAELAKAGQADHRPSLPKNSLRTDEKPDSTKRNKTSVPTLGPKTPRAESGEEPVAAVATEKPTAAPSTDLPPDEPIPRANSSAEVDQKPPSSESKPMPPPMAGEPTEDAEVTEVPHNPQSQAEPVAEDPRKPVPDPDSLKEAREQVRDVFRELYASTNTPAGRLQAAAQLLDQAKTLSEGASLYVVLDDARQFAIEAGAVELALDAADSLGTTFRLPSAQLKADTFTELARQVREDHQRQLLAAAGERMLAELVAADQYEAAEDVLKIATSIARRMRDSALITRLATRGRQVNQISGAYRALQQAQDTGQDTDLVTGRFLCFFKGDWEAGLPQLARSQDEQLGKLAQRELEAPTSVTEQIAIADAWWKLADEELELVEAQLRWHAGTWYEKALPSASGLEKRRLEKQLEKLAAMDIADRLFAGPIDLLRLIDVQRDAVRGAWQFDGETLVSPAAPSACLQIPFEPPRQYDLEAIISRQSGRDAIGFGLAGFGGQVGLIIDQSTTGGDNGLDLIDKKQFEQNESNLKHPFLSDGKPHHIKISVRRSGIVAVCDGKPIVNWQGELRRLSIRESWKVPNGKALFLTCHAATYRIEKLVLTPLP